MNCYTSTPIKTISNGAVVASRAQATTAALEHLKSIAKAPKVVLVGARSTFVQALDAQVWKVEKFNNEYHLIPSNKFDLESATKFQLDTAFKICLKARAKTDLEKLGYSKEEIKLIFK